MLLKEGLVLNQFLSKLLTSKETTIAMLKVWDSCGVVGLRLRTLLQSLDTFTLEVTSSVMAKGRERLDNALEALALICEPVEPPKGGASAYPFFLRQQ